MPCAATCSSVSSRESACTRQVAQQRGLGALPELRVGPVVERAVQHVPVHVDDRARRVLEAQPVQLVVDRGSPSGSAGSEGWRQPGGAQEAGGLRGARARDDDVEVVHRPQLDLPARVRQDRRALGEHHGDPGVRERPQRCRAAGHEQLRAQPREAHHPVDLGGDRVVGARGQPRGDQAAGRGTPRGRDRRPSTARATSAAALSARGPRPTAPRSSSSWSAVQPAAVTTAGRATGDRGARGREVPGVQLLAPQREVVPVDPAAQDDVVVLGEDAGRRRGSGGPSRPPPRPAASCRARRSRGTPRAAAGAFPG